MIVFKRTYEKENNRKISQNDNAIKISCINESSLRRLKIDPTQLYNNVPGGGGLLRAVACRNIS